MDSEIYFRTFSYFIELRICLPESIFPGPFAVCRVRRILLGTEGDFLDSSNAVRVRQSSIGVLTESDEIQHKLRSKTLCMSDQKLLKFGTYKYHSNESPIGVVRVRLILPVLRARIGFPIDINEETPNRSHSDLLKFKSD